MHEQQELSFLQRFISFANQNLAVLSVKQISFFLEFLMFYEVYRQVSESAFRYSGGFLGGLGPIPIKKCDE